MVDSQEESDRPLYTFEEEEPKKEEKEDYRNWKTATVEEIDEKFGILKEKKIKEVFIPIDREKKTVLKLYIKELSIDEVLSIGDMVTSFDENGNLKPNMNLTLKTLWHTAIDHTEPSLTWAKIKHYKNVLLPVLLEHVSLPSLQAALAGGQEKN